MAALNPDFFSSSFSFALILSSCLALRFASSALDRDPSLPLDRGSRSSDRNLSSERSERGGSSDRSLSADLILSSDLRRILSSPVRDRWGLPPTSSERRLRVGFERVVFERRGA